MKKVRIPKKDQGLDLFLKKKGKVSTKQGELLLNPVWNRINLIAQKQAPKQSWEQASEQA